MIGRAMTFQLSVMPNGTTGCTCNTDWTSSSSV
jgi:hypothetical protein